MRCARLLIALSLGIGLGLGHLVAADSKASPPEEKKAPKEVAGKADVMRHVKKHFAIFRGVEKAGEVSLQIGGQDRESSWPVLPDAQIKIDGWWGRLEQVTPGDRVWVWLAVDRAKKPVSVLMLADEVSEQDIHGTPYTIQTIGEDDVTIHLPGNKKVSPQKLKRGEHSMKVGDVGYVQSAGGGIRRWIPEANFESQRQAQQEWLRNQWRTEGLPATIAFLHPISGEMEVYLDHEGMRWGRHLDNGDKVAFEGSAISAQVKAVEPWRERTRVRLVTGSGLDQLELKPGQRISLKVPEPPLKIQQSDTPTDMGRLTGKPERIEWFLATIYCPCGIAGDRCTGMFYTLASCNVNACGSPKEHRRIIGEMIDEGLTDGEIFNRLKTDRGRDIWQPHLLR